MILLDLSAAFDTIDHNILINTLYSCFGICDKALSWFRSYLSGREQFIKIKDCLSDSFKLLFGVPQGSVLGPLLFTLYTAPLSKIIASFKEVQHLLYADDTQIYISITPENSASSVLQLQECLKSVFAWMTSNKLKLNPDKTELILFGNQSQQEELSHVFPLDILGKKLVPSPSVHNLGVILDSEVSLRLHVSSIVSSCFYHIKDLRRIRRFLPKSVALILANALVSNRIDYCNSLFYSLDSRQLRRLQAVQNTLSRIVTLSSRFSPTTPLLKKLHWLPIKYRIIFKTNVITYKALSQQHPMYLSSLLKNYSSTKNTRRCNPANHTLEQLYFNYKVHRSFKHLKHSYAFSGPRLWNGLPLFVRSADTIVSFRNRLKTYLFQLAFPP